MTGSYNETLSTTFSKNVRNAIMEVKADKNKIVFSDVFPNVKIKHGDGAMNLWSLENGYNNYLATSPTGTATGFGASLLIIDDLGTECVNNMKFTELFNIINTRLLNQKNITKTIISTNLSLQNLYNTYDERIVSRIVGNYNICYFFGDDIRFKKICE